MWSTSLDSVFPGFAVGRTKSRLKLATISPVSSSPRIASQKRAARLCPPTVHNQQSSCRDTASLWAWSHLPGASGLAPLLCDSTWRVVLPMASNPKSVQNSQRSSPTPHGCGSHRSEGRGESVQSHRCPERPHRRHSRRPAFIEIASCPSSPRRQVDSIVTECNGLCQ